MTELEIPVFDAHARPTGEVATVPAPAPSVWQGLELQVVRELQRFGCGCIWEERQVYAPTGAIAVSVRPGARRAGSR